MAHKKGISLLIWSTLLFSLMSILVRAIPQVGGLHTVFYRFLFSSSIMGILALLKVFPLKFVKSPLLVLRGLTGGVATYLFYLSIQKLGVGKGTVLVYSYPIFASILSAVFLKEKVSAKKWMVVLTAFTGFYLLASGSSEILGAFGLYELLAILGAVLSAVSVVLVKKLHSTDSTYAIFFAQAIVGFWIFVGPANVQSIHLSYLELGLLLGIGVTAVGAQLIMTSAYKHVNVSTGASFYLSVPVLNLILGWVFFKERLSVQEIIGAGIVLAACFVLTRIKG